MSQDLDFRPLTERVGLSARLATVRRNNLAVMGTTVVTLLFFVPLVVLVLLVATGNATDRGGVACLVLCVAGGAYGLCDVLGSARGPGALERFASANVLETLGGSTATHYAGSLFADGSHSVQSAVRTRGEAFVEVGDRFPIGRAMTARTPRAPELYLRVRLPGGLTADAALVTPELRDRLTRFAGEHMVEASRGEITVFGTRPLRASEPGRVEEAFSLAEALAATLGGGVPAAPVTTSGIPVTLAKPSEAESGRVRRPWVVVVWTLALLIVAPIGLTVVLAVLDDGLRGNPGATGVVVGGLLLGLVALVAWVARKMVSPQAAGRRRRSSR